MPTPSDTPSEEPSGQKNNGSSPNIPQGGYRGFTIRYDLLQLPPTPGCDQLALLAARMFQVSTVYIGLFDEEIVKWKSSYGTPIEDQLLRSTPDIMALGMGQAVVIGDLSCDQHTTLFCESIPSIRLFVAIPLLIARNQIIGAMWLLDELPREPDIIPLETLHDIAQLVITQLEMQASSRALAQARDVLMHERSRVEAQLSRLALYDRMTDLPSRTLLIERLDRAMMRHRRHEDSRFALMLLDLDRFKHINESLGHTVGDQVLHAIARRLEMCVRAGDTVAYLGGDEFAILLEEIGDVADVVHIAERIHGSLQHSLHISGYEIFTSTSIGIVLNSSQHHEPGDLLRDAEIAMYRAKNNGKSRHEIFDAHMHTRAVELLNLETDLRLAVERQEFVVHYQPIVSLRTGQVSSFEALVRWRHPRRGLLRPAEFLRVADETGLSLPMGLYVFRAACRQMHEWHQRYPHHSHVRISINMSGKQFSQPTLMSEIDQILRETGLDPRSLILEITEDTVIENSEAATAMITHLRERSVGLSLDDFGTGYSSLSYLHRFPTHTLKIDRSFVSRIGSQGENIEIVRTIVSLAHNLGMNVVAEGVETAHHLAYLRALACEYGQGFYFAPPMSSDEAEAFLRNVSG